MNFKSIELIGDPLETNRSVLLIANHMSWWDGFWAMYLNHKIIKRKFHFMMSEEHLRKKWFLNHVGGYSINKHSRSVIESLNYTSELLSSQANMVTIFPQGAIESMHQRNFVFEKGIEKLLNTNKEGVLLVFMVNLIDYFSSPKPGIYIYYKSFTDSDLRIASIQESYNNFYRECIRKQQTRSSHA